MPLTIENWILFFRFLLSILLIREYYGSLKAHEASLNFTFSAFKFKITILRIQISFSSIDHRRLISTLNTNQMPTFQL